jgi:uncharacterized protein (TIGR03000 family)
MFRTSTFVLIAVLSLSGLLGLTGPAQAQHHRSGGGHRFQSFGYGWYYPYSPVPFALAYTTAFRDPRQFQSQNPYFNNALAYQFPAWSRSYDSPYVRPEEPVVTVGHAAPSTAARIKVLVPDADAQVWIDGKTTSSRGMTRLFETPGLESGKVFSYALRASWNHAGRTVTEERVVKFATGTDSVADFTQPPTPEKIAPPPKD